MTRQSRVAVAVVIALGVAAGRVHSQEQSKPSEGGKPAATTERTKPEPAKGEAAKPDRPSGDRTAPRSDPRFVASVTLRVQLVISRFQGDKKQASLPYTFLVGARPSTAGRSSSVRMRMGVDTPVPNVTYDESGQPKSVGVQYRNVGTNLDCWATDFGDGSYQLNLSVENSSVLTSGPAVAAKAELGGAPLFRRFDTFIDPILHDGQTIQTVASTDPVTGEVVKIDVTLNVVK
jgi:hypothetical protein